MANHPWLPINLFFIAKKSSSLKMLETIRTMARYTTFVLSMQVQRLETDKRVTHKVAKSRKNVWKHGDPLLPHDRVICLELDSQSQMK